MPDPVALTETRAAGMVGVSARTLRRWRKAGAVSYSLTPGGRIFYSAEDLIQLRSAMHVEAIVGPR